MVNPLNSIANAFGTLGSAFSNSINALGDMLFSRLGNLYTKLSSIVDFINPAHENFILKIAFVPSETYFSEKFTSLKIKLESKLSISSYSTIIETFQNVSSGTFEDVEVNIMGVSATIIDSSSVNSVKNQIHKWVRGGVFLLLAFYNYNQVLKLIRGADYIAPSGSPSTHKQLNLWGD